MTLGDYIKKYRQSHELSMDDFAKMTGLSKAYVSILERNNNPSTGKAAVPSLETIKRVATATAVDFNDLISMLDNDQEVFVGQDDLSERQEGQRIIITGRAGTGKSQAIMNAVSNVAEHIGEAIEDTKSTPTQKNAMFFVSHAHRDSGANKRVETLLGLTQHYLSAREIDKNYVYACGRDGTTKVRILSDTQFAALMAIMDQIPETEDE